MKIYSTSFAIRKMQIKTKRYHNTPLRMARIQNTVTPNAANVMEQLELSFTASGKEKL